jgi:pyrroline-5-carboxylate reductase
MFRVMPNTAIAKGESMTLVSSENASKAQEAIVLQLFGALGKAVLIEEKLMGAATSVASCGIAYALRYLRAAVAGAVELGFRADVATEIVAQTMKGAVSLVEDGAHPEVEIDRVCTPGGWTVKGLNEMEANGFTNAVIKGLKANS